MGKDKVEEYRPQQPHRLYCLASLGVEGQKTKVSLACLSQYSLLQQTFLYLQNRKLCEGREQVHLGYHNVLLTPRRSLINGC